jgi:hypothetical protein
VPNDSAYRGKTHRMRLAWRTRTRLFIAGADLS